jgi:3-isopropylmalate dehydrogenase
MRITILPGDGIGPEVTREAVRIMGVVLDHYGSQFTCEEHAIGGAAYKQFGSPLPEKTRAACLASDAVLLGAVGGPEFDALPKENRPETGLLALRQALGGFANLRPAISYPSIADCSPLRPEIIRNADMLIVRELLGGIYFGQPRGFSGQNDAFNTMRYSAEEIERIAHVAFKQARNRRHKVASVDKANVLECSQLWRQVVTRVGRDYPDVKLEHTYVDSCAMRLVTDPGSFDVVLAENLFGDILSDEAAVIAGSLGMLSSATIGGKVDLYEPVHGSAPDIAGRGIANPIGAILSVAMLLRHSAGLEHAASDIEQAVREVLDAGYRTADINRGHTKFLTSTTEMAQQIETAVTGMMERRRAHAV